MRAFWAPACLPRRVRFPGGPIRPAGGDDRLALWLLRPSHAGDMAADRPMGTRHSRGRGVGWACRCGGVPSTALGAAREAAGHGKWHSQVARPQPGYGFIRPERGEDVSVHISAVQASGLQTLQEGQLIEFDIEHGRKGPHAANLRPRQAGASG
jgi:cold shock protein